MKRLILTTLTVCLVTGAAFAQSTANDDVTVSANLVPAITVTQTANLAFGNVARGSTNPVMSPINGNLTAGASTGSSTVGQLTVTGAPGEAVTISAPSSLNLTQSSGTSLIVFTPSFAESASASSGYSAGTAFTFTGSQGGTSAATHYVRVGGTLNISGATASGAYSGTLTVTVTYDSL